MYQVCTCYLYNGGVCPLHGSFINPQYPQYPAWPTNPQPYTIPTTLTPTTQKGWECPKCTRVYGPQIGECSTCNNLAGIFQILKGDISTMTTDCSTWPESLIKMVDALAPDIIAKAKAKAETSSKEQDKS